MTLTLFILNMKYKIVCAENDEANPIKHRIKSGKII